MRVESRLAAVLLGALYLAGLAPTVHVHDAGELTAAAWTLGLGHPPGAPLYMLVAKLVTTILPWGHIAWRANLLSALLAVGLFVLLAWWVERRGGSGAEAVVIGAVAGLAPVLWSQALMAEVYTLQALLLAAALVALDLGARAEVTALLWGAMLACHVGLAPLTPLLVVILVVGTGGRERLALLGRVGVAVLAPLTLYAYVPLRAWAGPAVAWGRPHGWRELWWYLSNQNVRARALTLPAEAYLDRALEYAAILGRNLHLALVVALLAVVVRGRRRVALLAAAVVAFDGAFVVLLDTAPLASEAYGTPAVVAVAVLAAIGLESVARRRLRWGALTALAAAVAVSAWSAHAGLDRSGDFVARDTAEAVLTQAPRGAALFVQEDNTTFPLAYLVAVEGARPDLEILDRAGNLFHSPYDRALHRVEGDLADFRRRQEEPQVEALLRHPRSVVFSTPFIEYEPVRWRLLARGTVAEARWREDPPPSPPGWLPPLPRSGPRPEWMSRQILAMDELRRASSRRTAGDLAGAREHLERAGRLADIAELHLQIGQAWAGIGDAGPALAAANAAIALSPRLAAGWALAARMSLLLGDEAAAEEMAGTALSLDPSLGHGHLTTALVAVRRAEWPRALAELDLAVAGGAGLDALINRALVRERLGDLTGAVADLDLAFARDPSFAVGSRRVAVMARAGLGRESVATALCATVAGPPPPDLSADALTRFLMVAAAAGGPACVEPWLGPVAAAGGEPGRVAAAYLSAVPGGGR